MNAVLIASVLSLVGVGDLPDQGRKPAAETWELGLAEAIRIGLVNSEVIRVDSSEDVPNCCPDSKGDVCRSQCRGAAVKIRWKNGVADEQRFKSEVMAHIRSVEQVYWELVQRQTSLSASEEAVASTEKILAEARAEIKLGRSDAAEVAEIEQRLAQFTLDLETASSNLAGTVRRLRNLLGLPASDSRQIVATTPPVESHCKPDWNECLSTMKAMQPDIVGQRKFVMRAAFHLFTVQGGAFLVNLIDPSDASAITTADLRSTRYTLMKQKAYLDQIVHQTTRSLARFFRELDAGYKHLQMSNRLRIAAKSRLETQRAFYGEGRLTVNRYLDAVGEYARAITQEAQSKATYNIAIVALEEAKGTLLAYDNITVVDSPRHSPANVVANASASLPVKPAATPNLDPAVRRTGGEVNAVDRANPLPPASSHVTPASNPPALGSVPKTVKFDVMIGDARPIHVQGTFTISQGGSPSSVPTPAVSQP